MAINKAIKFNGIQIENITLVEGVDPGHIAKISGVPGPNASKWIAGAGSGQIWRSTLPDAGYSDQTNAANWAKIADLGASQGKGIAVGENATGTKRWVIHRADSGEEIAYVNDGSELASPITTVGNWTEVNLSNDHVASNGGPSIAWGNGTWLGVGDDVDADENVLFGSSNGGSTWNTIDADPGVNDIGRVLCFKSNTTWFFTVQDKIFRTTSDPFTGGNWSQIIELESGAGVERDIRCMAFDATVDGTSDGRWCCIDQEGYAYTSINDWDSVDTAGPDGHQIDASFVPYGIIYVKGSINMWVAVGESGHIWTSPDGGGNSLGSITGWTQRTTPGTSDLYSVATDNTTIVAVGTSEGDPSRGSVYVSQDGVTWRNTAQNISVGTALWSVSSDLIGVGMRAVDHVPLWTVTGKNSYVAYSHDAITWSEYQSSDSGTPDYWDISLGRDNSDGPLWIIGTNTSPELRSSVDPTAGDSSWSSIDFTGTADKVRTVEYGANGTWIAGSKNEVVFRSTDGGENWTKITDVAAGATIMLCLATDGEGTWLAGGTGSSLLKSTDDGLNWYVSLAAGGQVNGVEYNNGVWFIASNTTTSYRATTIADNTSTDTWTAVTGISEALWAICHIEGNTWMTANKGTQPYLSTDNCASWSTVASPSAGQIMGLASDGTTVVTVGKNSKIYTSTDNGSSWSDSRFTSSASDLLVVDYNKIKPF